MGKRIDQLTENTTPATEDLFVMVDDPSSTHVTRKVTLGNVVNAIDVTDLPGLLADDQHVLDAEVLAVAAALVHKTRHQDGGADEISVTGLSGLLADDQHILDTEVINLVYPVGSIYISVAATNPGTLFGVGTWVAFGTGRVLVGIDATQTEFDVVEETGGENTHTLITAEMAAHTHTITPSVYAAIVGGGTTNLWTTGTGTPTAQTSSSTGSGGAHNNLQPYIVAYFWKRTV